MAWIALIAGGALFLIKLAVYAVTSSTAVLSDALESTVNLVAAAVMLYTLRLVARPPDAEHHYGHGKAEFLSVALEGAMVLFAALVIAYEAIGRLLRPRPLTNLDVGIWLVGGTALLTVALGVYVWASGRKRGSEALKADGTHLMTDAATTVAALVALIVVHRTGALWIDPVVALGMACFVLWAGARILRRSIDGLMDRFDPDDDAKCRAILDHAVREGLIRGYHKLRHRRNGGFCWVDMHVQMDPEMSVVESHAIASRIEYDIECALAPANATAHVEPDTQGAHP